MKNILIKLVCERQKDTKKQQKLVYYFALLKVNFKHKKKFKKL